MSTATLVIAVLALAVSSVTAWLTLLRGGTVRMTRPSTVYFGPDGGPQRPATPSRKVYLRTLLYATSKRGRIIESMFVRLRRGESSQNLSVWVLGEDRLRRGSGLFVGELGVEANHHFIPLAQDERFEFAAGAYILEVYASLVGGRSPVRLFTDTFQVTTELAAAIRGADRGLYFDWGPDSATYHPHVRTHPNADSPALLVEMVSPTVPEGTPPSSSARGAELTEELHLHFSRWTDDGGGL